MTAGCRFGFASPDAGSTDGATDGAGDGAAAAQTMFGASVPQTYAAMDQAPQEIGVRFQSDVAGTITAIRFHRYVPAPQGYTVHLWSEMEQLLGSGSVLDDTGQTPAWERAAISPVAIVPNVTYVAGYFAPRGQYSYETHGLDTAKTTEHLTALGSPNGVYRQSSVPTFPTDAYQNSNYFVDIEFMPAQ